MTLPTSSTDTGNPDNLQLIIVVEPGRLEWQMEYLLASLGNFSGVNLSNTWVISPRGLWVSPATQKLISHYGAHYIEQNLNPTWGFHPLSNKVFAGRYVESQVDAPLLFLDTDILVFNSLDSLVVSPGQIQVKTAHNSFATVRDAADDFWAPLLETWQIPVPATWRTVASGEHVPTLPYYNTGVVATHSRNQLFTKWVNLYAATETTQPTLYQELQAYTTWPAYHQQTRHQKQLYHIGQILFALTLTKHFDQFAVCELPLTHNYPLPKHGTLGRGDATALEELTCLHYHRALADPLWFTRFEASPKTLEWLVTTLYK